ncbi:MAG: hypothetical protein ACPHA0_00165 [Candidatus Poseidoniaceae archaeon]|jgi:TRAP-type uncharacterized transport system fused permease subunit
MIDDDGSAEMLNGFWPFLKRSLFVFLPLWVFLIFMSAGFHIVISAIVGGMSVSLVSIFEKKKMAKESDMITNGNNIIK